MCFDNGCKIDCLRARIGADQCDSIYYVFLFSSIPRCFFLFSVQKAKRKKRSNGKVKPIFHGCITMTFNVAFELKPFLYIFHFSVNLRPLDRLCSFDSEFKWHKNKIKVFFSSENDDDESLRSMHRHIGSMH